MLSIGMVDVSVEDDDVYAKINGSFDDKTEFHFYLCKEKKPISRHGWYESNSFKWENLEPGGYQIRGFARNAEGKVDKFSSTFRVIGRETISLFDSMVKKEISIPELPYSYLDKPHQDIALVVSRNKFNIPGFQSFSFKNKDSSITSLYKSGELSFSDRGFAFSGSAFLDGVFIYGEDDVNNISDISPNDEVTGDFSYSSFEDGTFLFTNDFLGNNKIFYYIDDDVVVSSNRVHLLLLIMSLLGVRQEINNKELHALLASGSNSQPFQQIFSPNLVVKGVMLLPIDKYIKVEDGCFDLVDKPIRCYFESGFGYPSESEYNSLLERGAEEVLNNTLSVLSHPRFKHVLVDATGGMDSRVTVAAASRFKEYKEKLVVNACNTLTIPDDITIGCAMAAVIGVGHDDLDETSIIFKKNKRKYSLLSKCLGTYFRTNIISSSDSCNFRPDTINITGAHGGACLRLHYSRPYFDDAKYQSRSVGELVEVLGNDSAVQLAYYESVYKEVFSHAVDELPGRTALEKYDLHYLFYRNGLHFSDTHRPNNGTPRVGTLQSPSLLKLGLMVRFNEGDSIIHNELIAYYNPCLLTLPYESKRSQRELFSCLKKLKYLPSNTFDVSLNVANDGSSAVQARAKKNISRVNGLTGGVENNALIDVKDLALLSVVYLYNNNFIDYDLSLHLASHVLEANGSHVIVNKVVMVCQMIEISLYSRKKVLSIFEESEEESLNNKHLEEYF
ncbi:hypothetical protein [Chromohalobacter japonicus]|uniref:hypothetical protein n=1 Tax=Chromohalobacter japonicus TaxID=223900 RepID=UPI001FF1190F|nr:hypothetical protein [Chromohalobacter japonicus]MCK0753255.1 hypothetical protein [Chromohalobacter japonicus]